ncbi:MAG: AAA family ATPase [Candidatus Poribacteria bacterium]|nr:AAA family ATPase [Candidatus Poribacteria bacterium]
MLHALELENFKAFGERARIPFAPITLIFGENSAGKSSILQALNLLKQTRESREAEALLLPRAENGIVDLGSFQEMLFDHDLKRTLTIRVKTKTSRELAIEFSFKRPSLEQEVLLARVGIYDGISSKCLAKFQPFETNEEPEEFPMGMELLRDSFFHDSRGLSPSKLCELKCTWLTKAAEYWKPEFEWCKENTDKILSWLKERQLNLERLSDNQIGEEGSSKQTPFNDGLQETDERLQRDIDFLYDDIEFFSSDFDLETYISKRRGEEINTIIGTQGFIPIATIVSGEKNSIITGPRSLLRRQSNNTETFDVAQVAMAAGRALEHTLEVLFPMGPFRRPPERWYIFTGTSSRSSLSFWI